MGDVGSVHGRCTTDPAPPKKRLSVSIDSDAIVIRLPLSTLPVVVHSAPWNMDENGDPIAVVADAVVLASEVVRELKCEEEDGTTLVHEMFDKAIERAFETGAEGFRYDD